MTAAERLTEIFDRAIKEGVDSLSPAEHDLYLIQDFIIDYEINDLSGYFYNHLPDLRSIRAAIASMRRCGLTELARLLSQAADLFGTYADADLATTWGDVLRKYDATGRLKQLSEQIRALDDYGLLGSTIA
jgi:hypothetical protein